LPGPVARICRNAAWSMKASRSSCPGIEAIRRC
jgi:hypothetical protein